VKHTNNITIPTRQRLYFNYTAVATQYLETLTTVTWKYNCIWKDPAGVQYNWKN